jgi:formylglycine-generating enzyme required for sulfatase activity
MSLAAGLALGISAMDLPTQVVKLEGHLAEYKMVKVPAGPTSKSIWVGVTEVTWDLYDIFAYRLDLSQEEAAKDEVIKARPSKPYGAPDRGYGHKGYPAIGVHVKAAMAFCDWLSKKTGQKFRLPTEAEWEYAAAAQGAIPTSWDDHAWTWDNADDSTHPVGSLKANAWGLQDMFGNASEWVSLPDGKFTTKGGHFYEKPKNLSLKLREDYDANWQMRDAHIPKSQWWLSDGEFVGFRIVRED